MSLRFNYSARKVPDVWIADAYITDTGIEIWLAKGTGDSPSSAIEAADNAARLALEKLLGMWAEDADVTEILR